MIEQRLATSQSTTSEWLSGFDANDEPERFVRLVSRCAGIVALVVGIVATAEVIGMMAG